MLKAWSSLKLHIQLAIASGVLLAITITITTYFNIKHQQQTLIDNTTLQVSSLANNIAIVSSYLVITNKLDELELLLVQSATYPVVSEIRALSINGHSLSHAIKQPSDEVTADYNLKQISPPIENQDNFTTINWPLKTMTFWQPIRTSNLIGWIKIDITMDEVIALRNQAITDNIISASIAIFFDILILLLILYRPGKSLGKIIEFARNMTNSPGTSIKISGGSYEINRLLKALNSSSLELEQQHKKIQQQAQSLLSLHEKQIRLEKDSEQRELLDSMLESVITIDQHGIIQTFNRAAEKLFGYTAQEVIGQNIILLMPSPHADEHQMYLQSYISGGVDKIIGKVREVEGKRKNNEAFPMKLSVTELPASEDGTRRFIGSCQDVGVARQQEEQLRQSQKMDALGKLTGGISHDYNNLLAIIQGYAELLKLGVEDNPKLSSYAQEIEHAAQRGAKLTGKLLGFSQIKAPRATVVNINKLLTDQRFMLEKTLSASIQLSLDLAETLWPVKIDPGDFEDCIINMSINAMHAMDKAGKLTLKTRNVTLDTSSAQLLNLKAGKYVALSIIDTGVGMDENTQKKAFDPFFTTKGEFGTGLGLSQVYGFIKQTNGSIQIDSELGKGCCFTLYFPKSDQSLSEIESETPEVIIDAKLEKRILVVDDEPALVELVKDTLTNHGYQIFTAYDAEQALDILKQEHIDLLITDVIMPNIDGYELARRVQNLYPHIKIQIVTGFTDDINVDEINQSLHLNRLEKPYSSATLLIKIQALLDE